MQYRACNTRPSVIYSTLIFSKDFSVSNRPPRWLIVLIVLISLPLLLPFLYVIERAADVGLARSIELLWRPRMWELLSNTLLLMVFVTRPITIHLATLICDCGHVTIGPQLSNSKAYQVVYTKPHIPAVISEYKNLITVSITEKHLGFCKVS